MPAEEDMVQLSREDRILFKNLSGELGDPEPPLTAEEKARWESLFGDFKPGEPASRMSQDERLLFYNRFGDGFERKIVIGEPVPKALVRLPKRAKAVSSDDSASGDAWSLDRKGERLASARAVGAGASVASLARLAGLDANEALNWLRDKNGNFLENLPDRVTQGQVYLIPNVWIAADLMRGGDLIDKFLNLGGTIGSFVGTDIFTNGFKVEKPTSFSDLIKTVNANKGYIWGMVLFAHGAKTGNVGSDAKHIGKAVNAISKAIFNKAVFNTKPDDFGHLNYLFSALEANGFRLAHAYAYQCYSGFSGTTTVDKAFQNRQIRNSWEAFMGKRANIKSAEIVSQNDFGNETVEYEMAFSWDDEWKKVAVNARCYSGLNVLTMDLPL